jgi:organic hydroperoxide reductase OsmC/OhrA
MVKIQVRYEGDLHTQATHGPSKTQLATATVEKHMVADPDRRIGKLEVELRIPGRFDEKARAILEKTALTCPVQQSLNPRIEVPVTFRWDEER